LAFCVSPLLAAPFYLQFPKHRNHRFRWGVSTKSQKRSALKAEDESNFNKNPEELETKFEKWVYLLKHLEFLERLPKRIQEKIFSKVMDLGLVTI